MKKIILIMLCLILTMTGTASAEPETESPDPNVPVIEEYNFRQTQKEIRDLLGNPDDEPDKKLKNIHTDEFFDMEYLGVLGHLSFTYIDDKLHRIMWYSPDITEEECNHIVEIASAYYDEKYGTDPEVKQSAVGGILDIYQWTDSFNNWIFSVELYRDHDQPRIVISKAKEE